MRKFILVISFVIAVFKSALSQLTPSLKGTVSHSASGQAISGAVIDGVANSTGLAV